MTDPDRPTPTDDLHRRLKAAQDRNAGASKKRSAGASSVGSGMGVGVKVGVDLVVGVGVGAGIGWGLDRLLGTEPWLLALFCILGFVAGLMNVIRTANQSFKKPTNDDNGR